MKTIKRAELRWKRVSLLCDKNENVYDSVISSSKSAHVLAKRLLEDEVHEKFLAFFLTCKNKVVGYQEVARGGGTSLALMPADVFRSAIIAVAPAIFIAHNHPSGDPSPSTQDISFTQRLVQAGSLIGIQIIDHIIIGEDGYFSFVDCGLMNNLDVEFKVEF
jgi:DNA repair protein RadC